MITVTQILGPASDPALSGALHDMEHAGRLELLIIDREDALRRRLRGKTDKGTDIAVALDADQRLGDGSVLVLDTERAVVVRMSRERWLRVRPRDADAALEAGYCAGNHHWRVKFEPGAILIAMQGPAVHYAARMEHLLNSGLVEISEDE